MMVALVPLLLGLSTAGMWGTRGGTRSIRSRPQCCTAADVDSAPVEAVLEAEGIASSELKDVAQAGCSYAGAFIKH